MSFDMSESLNTIILNLNTNKIAEIDEMVADKSFDLNKSINLEKIKTEADSYLSEKGLSKSEIISFGDDFEKLSEYLKTCNCDINPGVIFGIASYSFLPNPTFEFSPLYQSPLSTGRSGEIFEEMRDRCSGYEVHSQVPHQIGAGKVVSDLGEGYVTRDIRKEDLEVVTDNGIIIKEIKIGNVNGTEGLAAFKSELAADYLILKDDPNSSMIYSVYNSATTGVSVLDDPKKVDGLIRMCELFPNRVQVKYCDQVLDINDLRSYGTGIGLANVRNELSIPNFNDYVCFDLEHNNNGEITQIGAVKVLNGKIVDVFNSLVKPEHPIAPFLEYKIGITNEMVKNCPSIETVLPQFKSFVGDSVMVGHNIKNSDFHVLDKCVGKTGVVFTNDFFDTLRYSKTQNLNDGVAHGYNLEILAGKYGIVNDRPHDGLYDATTTHELYQKIKMNI